MIAETVRDLPRSGIRDFFDIVSSMHDVISLGVGEPDFVTPWRIREATIFALDKGATRYTSNLGLPVLREAISGYVARTFGIHYDPHHEILITVGVSEALDLAVRALVNPGDEVLYHEPCYVSYLPVVAISHGRPVAVRTAGDQGFTLRRDMLEEKVTDRTKVLILNYPNNPTGALLPEKDLREIAEFARERDLVVIADEIYAELTYDGAHTSIASLPGMKERTIFLHGFSKGWAMTGFRIGYACAPPALTEAMMKIHQYTMLCAPTLSQEAAIEALKNPEDDVREMRASYEKRRNFIYASFAELGIPCARPGGAFFAFPYVGNFGISSKDFALRFLDEEKVAVVPGTAFGPSGEGFVRCAYATSFEELKTAIGRLGAFVERL